MEDYIFLIIAVLLSIFGALNQNKKKKAQEDMQKEPKPRNSYSDPFLNFELMEVEDEEEEYERKRKKAAAKVEYKKSYEANKDMVFHAPKFKSTLPERQIKESLRPQVNLKQEEKTIPLVSEGTDLLEDFSLRKAIIYAEILKPKYNS